MSQTDATAKIVAVHANSADGIYNLEERVLETSAKNDLSACKAWKLAQGDAVEQNTAFLSALKSMVDVDVSDKGAATLENDEGDATLEDQCETYKEDEYESFEDDHSMVALEQEEGKALDPSVPPLYYRRSTNKRARQKRLHIVE